MNARLNIDLYARPAGFAPALFDRMLGDRGYGSRLRLEQLKDAVARDLADLLNTRAASTLTYGLLDITGFCLPAAIDAALLDPLQRR